MFQTFSKTWLINITIAVFVVFFGIMSFNVWFKGDEMIPEIQAGKSPEKSQSGKKIIERAMTPEPTYEIVAGKNLFSSSRSESLPAELKPGPLNISEKMIFLYGVVLTGERKQALITNPESGPAAGQSRAKEKWVKVGDTMGNLSVAEIRKDRIILTDGANKHEILLYDKNKPARQIIVAEKAASPAVVATGPAADTPKPGAEPPAAKPGAEPPASKTVEGKSAPSGEFKIIKTPFGTIKRRIE
ncbi:MAG: hypothetical protein EHM85_04320 [Desulfobacteraceae bacterium]|nr:MAG: hypothetical protein EHM85_04320 [Desulfobacteraceae bacterium]